MLGGKDLVPVTGGRFDSGDIEIMRDDLANLLLGRSEARRREIAVRLAIGAGRGRVIRQMLAEGMLLAAAGGALGVLIACWSANALI